MAFFKGTLVSSNEGIGLSVNSTTCHLDVSGWTTLNDSGYVLWIGFAAYQGDSGGPNYTEFASVVTTDDTDALDYARQNTAKTTLPNFKLDKMGDAQRTRCSARSSNCSPTARPPTRSSRPPGCRATPTSSTSSTTTSARSILPPRSRAPPPTTLKDDEVVYYASDFGNVVAHMEAPHLYTEGYGVPPRRSEPSGSSTTTRSRTSGLARSTHESASNFRWSTVATINGYTPLDTAASTPALTNSLDTDTAAFGSSSSGFTFIGLCYLDSDPANGTTNKSLIATATDTTRNVYFVRGASTAFMHVMVSSTAYTVSIDINTYLTASNWHLMVWRRLTGGDWYGYLDATNRSAATKANETNTWSFATMFGGGYACGRDQVDALDGRSDLRRGHRPLQHQRNLQQAELQVRARPDMEPHMKTFTTQVVLLVVTSVALLGQGWPDDCEAATTQRFEPEEFEYLGAYTLPAREHSGDTGTYSYIQGAMSYAADCMGRVDPTPDDGFPGCMLMRGHNGAKGTIGLTDVPAPGGQAVTVVPLWETGIKEYAAAAFPDSSASRTWSTRSASPTTRGRHARSGSRSCRSTLSTKYDDTPYIWRISCDPDNPNPQGGWGNPITMDAYERNMGHLNKYGWQLEKLDAAACSSLFAIDGECLLLGPARAAARETPAPGRPGRRSRGRTSHRCR